MEYSIDPRLDKMMEEEKTIIDRLFQKNKRRIFIDWAYPDDVRVPLEGNRVLFYYSWKGGSVFSNIDETSKEERPFEDPDFFFVIDPGIVSDLDDLENLYRQSRDRYLREKAREMQKTM